MRHLRFFCVAAGLLLSVSAGFAQTWNIGTPNAEDLTATLSDGTLTIRGTGAMQDFSSNAPWYNIRHNIITLVIEEGVTRIGNNTFSGCSNITSSLTIPESVTTIGNDAFYFCFRITGSLTIPEGVTTIGNRVFGDCRGLTGSLIIPKGVTTIGERAFTSCRDLTAINVNSSNANYSSDNGILYNKDKTTLIQCPAGKTGAIIIPESVIIIGHSAFYDCVNLTGSLIIPESITTIGIDAFRGCSGLSGSLIIPKNVKTIGQDAFVSCTGFTGSLTIQEGVTKIEGGAFWACSGFESLIISEGVTSIDSQAFEYCRGLISLTIPASVTKISVRVFDSCTGLNFVSNFAKTPQIIDRSVFNLLTLNNITLYVPYESLTLYQEAEVWKEFYIVGRYYNIKTNTNNDEYGTVSSSYASNDIATFTATPAAGCEFVSWTKNGVVIFAENPYTFTVTEDVEIVANFIKTQTAVNNIPSDEAAIIGYYSITGVKLSREPENGIYIILYDDGKAEKVVKMVK